MYDCSTTRRGSPRLHAKPLSKEIVANVTLQGTQQQNASSPQPSMNAQQGRISAAPLDCGLFFAHKQEQRNFPCEMRICFSGQLCAFCILTWNLIPAAAGHTPPTKIRQEKPWQPNHVTTICAALSIAVISAIILLHAASTPKAAIQPSMENIRIHDEW